MPSLPVDDADGQVAAAVHSAHGDIASNRQPAGEDRFDREIGLRRLELGEVVVVQPYAAEHADLAAPIGSELPHELFQWVILVHVRLHSDPTRLLHEISKGSL